jgi:hypothetical protein
VKRFARMCAVTCSSAASAIALLAVGPAPASACSGPFCVEAEFFPARGTVPANLPAVLFWPPSRWQSDDDAGPDSVAADDVRFVRLDAAGPVEVAFELVPSHEPSTRSLAGSRGQPAYRIVPAAELQPGARYALWTRDCMGDIAAEPPREPYAATDDAGPAVGRGPHSPHAVFDTTATAALPSALGSVMVSDPVRGEVELGGGSECSEMFDAASLVAEVERAGQPFFDAIAFVTLVDGKVYRPSPNLNYDAAHGGSWLGHGRDQLATLCDPDRRLLASGRHTLRFEGRVAGADTMLASETVDFELSCGQHTDGGSTEVGRDSGMRDASANARDGSPARRDAAADAADRRNATSPARSQLHGDGDGGGCAAAGNAHGGSLALLLALAFVRRRASAARSA